MKPPFAIDVPDPGAKTSGPRAPRVFAPEAAADLPDTIESLSTTELETALVPPPRRRSWLSRLVWASGGLLVSLAIGVAVDQLLRDPESLG